MFCTNLTSMLLEAPGWIVRSAFDRTTVTLLRHRVALGDTLMLTPLARGLKKARPNWRVAVVTRRPDALLGNPHVDEVRGWHLWRTGRTVRAAYRQQDFARLEHVVRIQWQALWNELRVANVTSSEALPELDGLHPELALAQDERRRAREILDACTPANRRGRPVVLTISGGKLLPVHNREWGLANYQALADALAPHATVIQVGGDAPLQHDGRPLTNLGGRPVRETGALFAAADAVLLQEGGLHHLARAVEAPSVVLFGGAVLPEQTGYDRQVNLSHRTDCSPCLAGRTNCRHLKCMVALTPRCVARALARVLAERGKSIPEEAIAAAPDRWIPPTFVDPSELAKALG